MRHAAQLSASSVHLDEEVLAEPPIGMMLLSRYCLLNDNEVTAYNLNL